jgi:Outer membrane lipoprotein-sorting protein
MKTFGSLFAAIVLAATDVHAWLENTDAARNAFEEAVISVHATQVENGGEAGSVDFDIYTKGPDRGLIVFKGGKNSGRKILNAGEKMWLLIPGASNPIPITPNQRLMGGASVADVARVRFARDYTANLRPSEESVNGRVCRVLDLTAKSSRAPYPRVVLWYDESQRLPARLRFFLPSGLEAKEITFTKFGKAAGKTVVTEMEVRDLLAKGTNAVTRLEFRDYRPAKIDDSIFTPDGAKAL